MAERRSRHAGSPRSHARYQRRDRDRQGQWPVARPWFLLWLAQECAFATETSPPKGTACRRRTSVHGKTGGAERSVARGTALAYVAIGLVVAWSTAATVAEE